MKNQNKNRDFSGRDEDANRDPLSGAPGAHPVGTGAGALAGGAAGAAVGAMGGPVGIVVGSVAGAVAGGLGGKGVAEMVDPTAEDAYWKDEYANRSYTDEDKPYETYHSAYRTGYEGYSRYPGKKYEDVESDLQRDYEESEGNSDLSWDNAKHATRDAWRHVEESFSGNTHGDKR